jgi:hypothetical protein
MFQQHNRLFPGLADHPNTPRAILEMALDDDLDREVELANNPALPDDLALAILKNRAVPACICLAQHRQLSEDMYDRMIQFNLQAILFVLGGNPRAPQTWLRRFARTCRENKYIYGLRKLAGNPALPEESWAEIWDQDDVAMKILATNPSLPYAFQLLGARSKNVIHRYHLLFHPTLRRDVIELMSSDPHPRIRAMARRRLGGVVYTHRFDP